MLRFRIDSRETARKGPLAYTQGELCPATQLVAQFVTATVSVAMPYRTGTRAMVGSRHPSRLVGARVSLGCICNKLGLARRKVTVVQTQARRYNGEGADCTSRHLIYHRPGRWPTTPQIKESRYVHEPYDTLAGPIHCDSSKARFPHAEYSAYSL